MRDRIGVPALRKHRDGDDAANRSAKLSWLADRVHDFPEQFLVGDLLAGAHVASALDDFTAKSFDLVGRHRAEVFVEGVARFELFAVDQQSVGARQRVAGYFIEVAKQGQATIFQSRRAILIRSMEAGDEVVDQLGD